jgi:hypothetical protein
MGHSKLPKPSAKPRADQDGRREAAAASSRAAAATKARTPSRHTMKEKPTMRVRTKFKNDADRYDYLARRADRAAAFLNSRAGHEFLHDLDALGWMITAQDGDRWPMPRGKAKPKLQLVEKPPTEPTNR